MSTAVRAVGNSPISARGSTRYSPLVMIAASKLVPPMSAVTSRSMPSASPSRRAPSTPPTGPELNILIGVFAASPTETKPPSTCISLTGAVSPRSASAASSSWKCPATTGLQAASRTVVTVRSYSR